MTNMRYGWLVGWLAGWLADWLDGWMVKQSEVQLSPQLEMSE